MEFDLTKNEETQETRHTLIQKPCRFCGLKSNGETDTIVFTSPDKKRTTEIQFVHGTMCICDKENNEKVARREIEINYCPMCGKPYNHGEILLRAIELAKHTVGLDYSNPYTRHGRKHYKPYRNYYTGLSGEKTWEWLVDKGYAECKILTTCDGIAEYHMTASGLEWLGQELGIEIAGEVE